MSGIDVVESRISALQNTINALANGVPPTLVQRRGLLVACCRPRTPTCRPAMDAAGGAFDCDRRTPTGSAGSDRLATSAGRLALPRVDHRHAAPTRRASTGTAVVADAKKYLGVPYKWGGTDPATGLDCSGLVQRVMKDLGVSVPAHGARPAQRRPGGRLAQGRQAGRPAGLRLAPHRRSTSATARCCTRRTRATTSRSPTSTRRRPGSAGSCPAAPTWTRRRLSSVRPISLRQSTSSDASHRYDALFERATRKYDLPHRPAARRRVGGVELPRQRGQPGRCPRPDAADARRRRAASASTRWTRPRPSTAPPDAVRPGRPVRLGQARARGVQRRCRCREEVRRRAAVRRDPDLRAARAVPDGELMSQSSVSMDADRERGRCRRDAAVAQRPSVPGSERSSPRTCGRPAATTPTRARPGPRRPGATARDHDDRPHGRGRRTRRTSADRPDGTPTATTTPARGPDRCRQRPAATGAAASGDDGRSRPGRRPPRQPRRRRPPRPLRRPPIGSGHSGRRPPAAVIGPCSSGGPVDECRCRRRRCDGERRTGHRQHRPRRCTDGRGHPGRRPTRRRAVSDRTPRAATDCRDRRATPRRRRSPATRRLTSSTPAMTTATPRPPTRQRRPTPGPRRPCGARAPSYQRFPVSRPPHRPTPPRRRPRPRPRRRPASPASWPPACAPCRVARTACTS